MRKTADASERMSTDDIASQLCVGCGMCCDGVLYDRAEVAEGEADRMRRAGLDLFETEGKSYFRQPCPHSRCGRCMIYETRFRICRTFECALLRRVERGDVELSDAQEKVALAMRLLAKVVEADPRAKTARERIRIRAALAEAAEGQSGEERRTISRRLLDIVALDSFLEQWFRHRSAKPETEDEAAILTARL
jgi:hypothetical protein